jgi:ribonucleoside-triphosphate reductase
MLSDERLIQLMDAAPERCQERPEVYSRVCGFFRPVQQWNKGKQEEFRERKEYKP